MSAWGNSGAVKVDVVPSLSEIMDEQLARKIQSEETPHELNHEEKVLLPEEIVEKISSTDADDTSNDFLVAQALQYQFDLDHDIDLKYRQKHINGASKVELSFANYMLLPMNTCNDILESSEDEDDLEYDIWYEKPIQVLSKKGFAPDSAGKFVTKHDKAVCDEKNTERLMGRVGDNLETGSIEHNIPNKVFNQLKTYSAGHGKRSAKVGEKKDHSTLVSALDEKTRILVFKMINAGVIEDISGVIKTGKESAIFRARGGWLGDLELPKNCILKVYKTTLTDFKNRSEYLKGDKRFVKDSFKKLNPRKIIRWWTEKERVNLFRLEKAGMNCPRVFLLKKHVLIMSMIGDDETGPAPKLHEAHLTNEEVESAFGQSLAILRSLYHDCALVHADFSTFNLLWFDKKVHVIDVGQAVDLIHPQAFYFLLRDCTSILKYFRSRLEKMNSSLEIPTPQELFLDITEISQTVLTPKMSMEQFLLAVETFATASRAKPTALTTPSGDFVHPYPSTSKQRRYKQDQDEMNSLE